MNTTLRERIDWVGCVDWTVRDFHSYDTEEGTTYNAYLIRDEKTALIDTVKAPFADELLRNVAALKPLSEIDLVVCNHAEPDHSGALPRVMTALPQATLVCDKRCRAALAQHFDTSSWRFQIVAEGDSLSLGRRTLAFVETPMVHWPESMFTYVPEEKLLFSMDAFGQHYASSERFDDELPLGTILDEAKAYYANIVMPYGKQVVECLAKAAELEIEMIATSHGLIWRSHVADIVAAYRDWSAGRPKAKVLVIYDTMWQSTDEMARAILQGASQPGVQAKLINIRRSSLTRIATEVLDAAAIAFGSATLNRMMMPMAGAVLTYLKGLRPVDKAGFAFGSYGWGRGGPEAIEEWLQAMPWEILRKPLKAQYRPTPEIIEECLAAGRLLADQAVRKAAG
ncbi:MAG: FprA family A-type flavoprotein [Pirellulales bacterium]|nr:FprA family A-type flavoprotein [Pirellulales bacterium]